MNNKICQDLEKFNIFKIDSKKQNGINISFTVTEKFKK